MGKAEVTPIQTLQNIFSAKIDNARENSGQLLEIMAEVHDLADRAISGEPKDQAATPDRIVGRGIVRQSAESEASGVFGAVGRMMITAAILGIDPESMPKLNGDA